MIRICFVCLGNICRSPMAEFILKDKLKKNNITFVLVDSLGTSSEEEGNDIYYLTKDVLDRHNIPYTKRSARRMVYSDRDKYDYIYYMEDANLVDIERIIGHSSNVRKLLPTDIEDPWYTRRFDYVYDKISLGCDEIISRIKEDLK